MGSSPGMRPGHHELDPPADRHRMVGGAFVVAPDERNLHRPLQRTFVGGAGGEDRAEELLLEVVHHVVHVGQRGRDVGIGIGEGVDREVHLHARLRAHALDDPADARCQLAREQAAGLARNVAHQARRQLDLLEDPEHREQGPEVAGKGVLEREQLVHPLFELDDPGRSGPRASG